MMLILMTPPFRDIVSGVDSKVLMSGISARRLDSAPSMAMRHVLKDSAGGLAGIDALIDRPSQFAGRRSPETDPMSHTNAQPGPADPAAKRLMQASNDAVVTSW
ncbi:hypothetical protein ACCD06_23280 [Azospirillum sp. CT11-132]|uniref:hypothetical protein n=1 Tax=Azospirillum sp. CT11-132 TaxID=3396317 RepID=UPI0039A6BE34